jgi:hypothetical protein
MVRLFILSSVLAVGLTTAASAGIHPAPAVHNDRLVVNVAEGCGPGYWRSPEGRCHPVAVNSVCPAGYHLGPDRKRCWPN